jgi:transcriptional regulator with XRE-family HTH domain
VAKGRTHIRDTESFRANLGKFMRSQREARGWSQNEVGRRLGMNQPKVTRMERGVVGIDTFPFTLVGKLFGVKVEDIYSTMFGIEKPNHLHSDADCTKFVQAIAESGIRISYADLLLLLKVEGDLRKSSLTATKEMIPGLLAQVRSHS